MNMSLKITNRDKILLVLLAVILFAGMMYVYGIMPTNSEIETLEKQITEKQQELRDLQLQVASINISALEKSTTNFSTTIMLRTKANLPTRWA